MFKRSLLAAALMAAAIAPLAGQTTSKSYKTPKTAWGDPDLQGNFTNLYENGTPLERPKEFEGRSLDDVKGEELARIKQATQERTINNFQGPIHAPDNWWQDALDLKRGSQAWLIVDPPDGKVPPMLPEAEKRIAARAEARRNLGHGPADSWEDRSLYDRCLTRGLPGSMMPAIYGNSYQIVQGQGYVAIRYEMIHETRVIPLGNHPHVGKNVHLDMGDARGRWEGDTLVVETTNFNDRSVYRNASRRHAQAHRAFHAHRAGQGQVVGDRRGSVHLDASVDVCHAADAQRRRAADALRVPRRQLRVEEHPERRPRGRKSRRGWSGRCGRRPERAGRRTLTLTENVKRKT